MSFLHERFYVRIVAGRVALVLTWTCDVGLAVTSHMGMAHGAGPSCSHEICPCLLQALHCSLALL